MRKEPRWDRRSASSSTETLLRCSQRKPFAGSPVRSCYVGQRPPVLLDIGQEQPRFHGGVKGIGMQLQLRIGRAIGGAAEDRLNIIERLASSARDVRHHTFPGGAVEQSVKLRKSGAEFGIDRDPARQGIALLVNPARKLGIQEV